ncbi:MULTISPECIES: ImmA/IrrE family metallo-endopeptidase [unclassified Exiguobacterium]|uniref:ImmA/IrrE family metallo-endopeptidase n=1 Tax=unclassified Exiguobacterium TaxID=2644629 RepID=UPI001576DFEE|nr:MULTISPECIES: ImmA/IrrE family metallo-endopeptidase [unclassified Exiguobacterium]MCQ4089460.1 ImmA/IrrE family metallo-endopeptidase [Exiguobacterium sp. LL15]NTY10346.1 ImmA/IrrE family metallo-endopeptidase [Exiguobacterium sp. JMULE1]
MNQNRRITHIKDLAQIIHKYVYPERTKVDKVDSIIELLRSLGVEVYESKMSQLNISGYVTMSPDSEKPMIVVNSDEPVSRQRFTMAHELGHLLLHFNWVPNTTLDPDAGTNVAYRHHLEIYSPNEKVQEYEANMFAAELLMPSHKFRELNEKKKDDADLANYFGVSKSAIDVRKNTIEQSLHA